MKPTTFIATMLLVTGLSAASPMEPGSSQAASPPAQLQSNNPKPAGFTFYLQDAPVSALDSSVHNLPQHTKPSLYMSHRGLFRYAYFLKTGKWLEEEEVRKALRDPYDQGNW